MEEKRSRTVNFTRDERAVLTELVGKYRETVENKKSDATSNSEKLKGWTRLSEEFNSVSTHCLRSAGALKTCWENIKRQIKKENADRKREFFKTGGGGAPGQTRADQMVESILGPALQGLENPYDSDAVLVQLPPSKDIVSNDFTPDQEELYEVVQEVDSEILNTEEPTMIEGNSREHHNSWENWTPNMLKRPLSNVLKDKNSTWTKRRRPEHHQNLSLNDQLLQEKINLVKTMIETTKEESKKQIQILDEQLTQEKIKTSKLL